jgi:hypothetical protein
MSVLKNKIEIKGEIENDFLITKVFIDGHQIPGVRSVTFKQDMENLVPVLTLDLSAFDITLDSPIAKVNILGKGEIKNIEFEERVRK